MNTKETAEIWKEYFDKLLNVDEWMVLIKAGNRESSAVELEEPTIEDVVWTLLKSVTSLSRPPIIIK